MFSIAAMSMPSNTKRVFIRPREESYGSDPRGFYVVTVAVSFGKWHVDFHSIFRDAGIGKHLARFADELVGADRVAR